MSIPPPGLRFRQTITLFALAFGLLLVPRIARADLLVNDLSENVTIHGVSPAIPGQIAPAVAYSPHGPCVTRTTPGMESGALLALLGVCIHPPVNDPTSGGGTKIGGEGGGNPQPPPVHTASTTPEPGGLVIGMIGAGLAGLAGLVRRRRAKLLA